MSTRVENINSEIIEWAIRRNGMEPEEFYAQNPKVQKWINKEVFPTVKQLEDFTHKVHVPFGYLFLPQPPNEKIDIPFFRTGNNISNKVSLNVFHTIQLIQDRQNWLVEYLDELGFEDLEFVGKYKYNPNLNPLVIVNDIRKTLSLEIDWASKYDKWEDALEFLTVQIEEIGIIVNYNGIVGTNTKRKIEVEECRGFVLVDKKAPFLFINAADAKAAQMFTIIHELAHVWLGKSAGFNNKDLLPADDPIEILCDKVAAEFLVPETYFITKWQTTQNFKYLSRIFKVSQIVIARRALDLKLISKEDFFNFYNNFMADFKAKKEQQGSGGNYYATAKKRISLRFASFINSAVRNNKLLYRDAYKLTNLKGDTYSKFVTEYLYQ
ncbi:ImmA/IrrE family metallo-endopeptidase [Arcicella sp. DC2W]|uniref:ImmA/IrrE family metallo-endopeptidase n=1 Tax=Arcicella gelida TaxID=2984195 RepID=A0ABU5SA54_9BACT|nr:ImmA/IrrE family metallo-endopeptidase [Arcicella sp. DC2W]MEA5405367.1 ImmA/IrrE family metallo-endopeptidase [Arcicella sp. DC2W]